MSALALVFRPDGPPGNPEELSPSMDRLVHRGPDGGRIAAFPGGVVGHRRFRTTPEETGEHQPLTGSGGRYVLAFDGRLDQRRDLGSDLGLTGPETARLSDAALVLAAWERWEEAAVERFLGPFVLAVADRFRRRVVCARDALGDRTLFYARRGDLLIAASEEQAVLAHPSVPGDLDETSLAAFFGVSAPAPGATFFRAVSELPAATSLTYDRDGLTLRRYWTPTPARTGRTRDERTEQFAETLRRAVADRLRSTTPVAVSLSGGLDSTAVAAIAARESTGPLATVSWVFDELTTCDERAYMDPVVEALGLDPVRFAGDHLGPDPTHPGRDSNTPFENPYRRLKERAYGETAARGVRVLLTGVFGDHLYTGGYARLTEYLDRGDWSALAGGSVRAFRTRGLQDPTLRHLARRMLRRTGISRERPPAWLTERGASLWPEGSADFPFPSRLRARQARTLLGPTAARSAHGEIGSASRHGVELRHPYRDRRMVELALGLPAEDLFDGDQWKPILRRATAGRLPDVVRRRRRPTSLRPLLLRGLARHAHDVAALLWSPDALWRRFVRPEHLESAWRDLLDPRRAHLDGPRCVLPWNCLSAELWSVRRKSPVVRDELRRSAPVAAGGLGS